MKRTLLVVMLCGLCAAVLVSPAPAAERVSTVEKGSLLVIPKVEIMWDWQGNVIQDTFIDMTNDFAEDVYVQMYFCQGDGPTDEILGTCESDTCVDGPHEGCACGSDEDCYERAHPGCGCVDVMIRLTANEPTYWSANTGLPKGTSPFTIMDPGFPPGRPGEFPCERRLRGYILAWAVDGYGEQISWNHLKADVLVVDYLNGAAWEYNAHAFQVHSAERGDLVLPEGSDPAVFNLDGVDYDFPFDKLLLDFYAVGACPFSAPGYGACVDTDLTLMPLDIDLRQDGEPPVITKASFEVWNMNEVKFTGMHRCINCWDQERLENYAFLNHFKLENLHTDKGKARIDGKGSSVCGEDAVDTALVGVTMKMLTISNGGTNFAKAGTNLVGMGTQAALIQADVNVGNDDEFDETPGGDLQRDFRLLDKGPK